MRERITCLVLRVCSSSTKASIAAGKGLQCGPTIKMQRGNSSSWAHGPHGVTWAPLLLMDFNPNLIREKKQNLF